MNQRQQVDQSAIDAKDASDFVIGVDFGGTKVAIAIASLAGDILEQTRIETAASQGAQQAVERSLTVARSLMAQTAGTRGGRCVAAGAVSPGIILPDRVLLAPNVPGWEQLAFRDVMREGLGIESIAVENDVKAAALAETRWGSLQGADPGIFLNVGTGLALSIVTEGKVLRGAHGAAGEIGYSLRGPDDELGFANGHAPLEEAAGGRAIGERGSKILGGNLSAADVFASSDPRAQALVDEALSELALHIANIAILLDPARIAVGGGMMRSGNRILQALEARLRFAAPFPPELVAARFVHDGALRGAIALALSAVNSH